MNDPRFYVLLSLLITCGCSSVGSRSTRQTIEEHQKAVQSYNCPRVAMRDQGSNSIEVKFERPYSPQNAGIFIYLSWMPSSDPLLYSPRGPMVGIQIREGNHIGDISRTTIDSDETLRTIEDIWPDLVTVSSKKTGEYDVMLFSGVPKGVGAQLIRFNGYKFKNATNLVSEHYHFGRPK
jgi:hypothetical protein